jgi:MoxR-like ATPase
MNSVQIEKLKNTFKTIQAEIGKVVIGQEEVIEQVLVGMLCQANVLLESYPGLGKTLLIKTISDIMDLKFTRIQCTPDLMPSDIIGTEVLEEVGGKRHFKFQQGPVFSNIVLADEINRATPKTQAALLEAMQEKQVTAGNVTHKLDKPFFVLATQNPIEQEGTYPLPEAQTDRFLLKVLVKYPEYNDEISIVQQYTRGEDAPKLRKILGKNSVVALQKFTRQVPVANDLIKYVVNIVTETRKNKQHIEFGASPRASIGLILAAKARAIMKGRAHVSSEDIKALAVPVLRHRIILNFDAERQGLSTDDVINNILKKVKP